MFKDKLCSRCCNIANQSLRSSLDINSRPQWRVREASHSSLLACQEINWAHQDSKVNKAHRVKSLLHPKFHLLQLLILLQQKRMCLACLRMPFYAYSGSISRPTA